jgi:KaiC/GvpD/RAD55 family RecA-like ATPase
MSSTVHSVHFYAESASLIARLCSIVRSALQSGDSVLIVATTEHREQLIAAVSDTGMDVRTVAREGRFRMFDAEEALATFMRNGMPDRSAFMHTIGNLLRDAKRSAKSENRGLTVFGEMVAVLWEQGEEEAAIALEDLWNSALQDEVFHLHCAYPAGCVTGNETAYATLCASHTHVV